MKTAALLLASTLAAFAGPLQRDAVSADAKWVLHLDVENALGTKLGEFVAQKMVDAKLDRPVEAVRDAIGFDLDWRKVRSITAYGFDFEPKKGAGAVVIEHGLDAARLFELVNKRQESDGVPEHKQLRPLTKDPFPLHTFRDELYLGVLDGKLILAKTREHAESAWKVLIGRAPTLAKSKTFATLPSTPKSFFFLGAAEGFAEKAGKGPQADVLKNAQSGHLSAAEQGDQIQLSLSLAARDAATAAQISQIVQGFAALVQLSESAKPEHKWLARTVKASADAAVITITAEFPTTEVVGKIREKANIN